MIKSSASVLFNKALPVIKRLRTVNYSTILNQKMEKFTLPPRYDGKQSVW